MTTMQKRRGEDGGRSSAWMVFMASLFAIIFTAGRAGATPVIQINDPTNGSTVDAEYTQISGTVSAIGGGQGIDLMLVVDDSGSLSWTDPTNARFTAIEELLNGIDPSSDMKMGMIFFSNSASVSVNLDFLTTSSQSIRTAITNRAAPNGLTAIGGGLNAAVSQFSSRGRSGATKMILLFTDGEETAGGDPVAAAAAAAAAGIVVNVVDLGGNSNNATVASAGNGIMLSASDPSQLPPLFRDSRLVGISSIEVRNTTANVSAPSVSINAGVFVASLDLAEGSNVLEVTATDTNGASATSSVTVTRPVAVTPVPVVTRQVKMRPQVLMAGFDPMLVDITDTEFMVTAVVREGQVGIQHVTLSENTGGFAVSMTYRGQLVNGDNVYSLTYSFARGSIPANTPLANLFGSNAGEFNITAIDQSQQSHSFPNLEFGNNQLLPNASTPTVSTTYTTRGPQRLKPQPLMVGFDPALIDYNDTSFKIKAIVRPGRTGSSDVAIQSVTLRNGGAFRTAMTSEGTISNGDQMYSLEYVFPRGSFPNGAFRDLFGEASTEEFVVEVTDAAQQSHRFPVLEVGNYPSML